MTFDNLDDYESDWISGTCPSCSRSIHIESGCVATCHHCGWSSEPTQGERESERGAELDDLSDEPILLRSLDGSMKAWPKGEARNA
jgi:hypothetical protein